MPELSHHLKALITALYHAHQLDADQEHRAAAQHYRQDQSYIRSWLSYARALSLPDPDWLPILLELLPDPAEADDAARAFVSKLLPLDDALRVVDCLSWPTWADAERQHGLPKGHIRKVVFSRPPWFQEGRDWIKVHQTAFVHPAAAARIADRHNFFKTPSNRHWAKVKAL